MSDDQIEMWWKCSTCGTINGGLSKKCGERVIKDGKVTKGSGEGCGKPQDREDWFMPDDISVNANLTDAGDIAKAKAGVDWYCGYCGSTQRRTNGECASCGGDKEASKEDRNGKYNAQSLEFSVPAEEHSVIAAHEWARERLRETPRHETFPPPPVKTRRNILPFAIGGLALMLLVWFFVWLFTPRYVEAKVQSVSWLGTVHVERYSRFPDSGWYAPGDAEDVRFEGPRVHHYDHVLVGHHQESYSAREACGQDCRSVSVPRSCRTNKNGSASCSGGGSRRECSTRYCSVTRYRTVNDYRDEPRYQMWYSWYVWRWRHNRDVNSSGTNLLPYEPTGVQIALNTGCLGREQERRSQAEFRYNCTFLGEDGKTQTYEPRSEQEFKRCTPGRRVRLKFTAGSMSIERWE
jgi:hypothetical protein